MGYWTLSTTWLHYCLCEQTIPFSWASLGVHCVWSDHILDKKNIVLEVSVAAHSRSMHGLGLAAWDSLAYWLACLNINWELPTGPVLSQCTAMHCGIMWPGDWGGRDWHLFHLRPPTVPLHSPNGILPLGLCNETVKQTIHLIEGGAL